MGKILALDIGDKRVGYAVSDSDHTMAFPRGFLLRHPHEKFLDALKKIKEEDGIEKIVIGLPLDDENKETVRAELIHQCADKISKSLSVPIIFIDEFGSTQAALSKIPFRKDRRKKGSDDAIAAQVILERYLVAGPGFEPGTSRL